MGKGALTYEGIGVRGEGEAISGVVQQSLKEGTRTPRTFSAGGGVTPGDQARISSVSQMSPTREASITKRPSSETQKIKKT